MQCIAALLPLLLATFSAFAGTVDEYAAKIAPLIDPAKLATLGPRGANPRVQKITYWLAMARADGHRAEMVAAAAVARVGMTNNDAAHLTRTALVRNLVIADRLGCLDADGMAEMRKGNAPTVRRGPYSADALSVDHIIPFAVVPELDRVIANLELLPQRANSRKNSSVGARQRDLAKKLHAAGLLSKAGLQAVLRH